MLGCWVDGPPMVNSEARIQNAVVCFLPSLGYRPMTLRTTKETGVDIKARHESYSRYFEIEVKGEPGKAAKSQSSGREVRFITALGQILTRINPDRHYYYGVAFPDTYKDLAMRRVDPVLMKTLRLSFFFVSESGRVEHMDWRDMRRSRAA